MALFGITYRAVSNFGEVITDDYFYNHEPAIFEVYEDAVNFLKDHVPVFYEEHPEVNQKSRKWYSNFDIIGWVNEEDDNTYDRT